MDLSATTMIAKTNGVILTVKPARWMVAYSG